MTTIHFPFTPMQIARLERLARIHSCDLASQVQYLIYLGLAREEIERDLPPIESDFPSPVQTEASGIGEATQPPETTAGNTLSAALTANPGYQADTPAASSLPSAGEPFAPTQPAKDLPVNGCDPVGGMEAPGVVCRLCADSDDINERGVCSTCEAELKRLNVSGPLGKEEIMSDWRQRR